jgi:hypothetical protein
MSWQEFELLVDPGIFVLGYDANNDSEYTKQNTFEFSGEEYGYGLAQDGNYNH